MNFKINDRVECPVGIGEMIKGTVVDIEGDVIWVNFDNDGGRVDYRASELNHLPVPLTFDEWYYQSDVESHYDSFHSEYGDSAALLSDYEKYHYDNYLERFKIYGKYTLAWGV
jgi:hypothetical protein